MSEMFTRCKKPAHRRYKWSRDAQSQADLCDVQNLSIATTKVTNTCFTEWILSAPRHGMVLKTKQGQELVKAFQSILSSKRK